MIIYFVNDPERRVNYTGHFINGTRHGTGQTVWSNSQIYVGEYQYDKESGIGVLRSASETYEGEFANGLRHGKGVIVRDDEKMKGVWDKGQLMWLEQEQRLSWRIFKRRGLGKEQGW